MVISGARPRSRSRVHARVFSRALSRRASRRAVLGRRSRCSPPQGSPRPGSPRVVHGSNPADAHQREIARSDPARSTSAGSGRNPERLAVALQAAGPPSPSPQRDPGPVRYRLQQVGTIFTGTAGHARRYPIGHHSPEEPHRRAAAPSARNRQRRFHKTSNFPTNNRQLCGHSPSPHRAARAGQAAFGQRAS